VELIGEDTVTMMEVMKATKELMACRKIGLKKYELTIIIIIIIHLI
jgi:hypothetical protein